MSDDQRPWQPDAGTPPPPPSGFAPPSWSPPAAPQDAAAVGQLASSPPPSPPRSSKGKIVGGLIGVGALVAAGAFAVTQMSDDADEGGAASPTEVGTELIAALEQEDLLGAVDLLLPGERDTFREPLIRFVDGLKRIEVLDESATLDDIGGVDFAFTDIEVEEEATNVDDIVDIVVTGNEETTVDGDEVPIGSLLIDRVWGGERPNLDAEPEESDLGDMRLTTVERDGRWYLSVLYSAAQESAAGAEVPEEGVEPQGADSPEGAIDQLLQAAVALDVEAIVAGLNPNEAEALQRYAPLFLGDVPAADDVLQGAELSLTDTEYSVKGSGSSRYVGITAFTFTATFEGETVTAALADGCLTVDVPEQESIDSCEFDTLDEVMGEMSGDVPPEATEAIERLSSVLSEVFADYESTGFKVDEVDGSWYFSPIGTYADLTLSVLDALDREEVETLIDEIERFGEVMGDLMADSGFDPFAVIEPIAAFDPSVLEGDLDDISDQISDEVDEVDEVDESGSATTFPVDDTVPPGDEGDQGDDFDFSALMECYSRSTTTESVACIQQGVAGGTIDPFYVGPAVAYPECGIAEIYYDNQQFELDDASFVAMATAAAPCFQGLVAAGTIDELMLPVELARPDCLEGRNHYNHSSDAAYTTRLYACAYS